MVLQMESTIMQLQKIHILPILIIFIVSFQSFLFCSCKEEDVKYAAAIENRDSLPVLKSIGVSTLISDSGIISYKIIAEEWFMFDKKNI